ncbi:hypothetical protein PGT21_006306 [Puccinia graminis f. sp. tritici]|uniref:Uncharacterized protein n=1 Tax=Puccinia graminis f. sp. tritici TaxID=56615 RepID=A0A5B0PVC6_PUCGR|nr:hypothetical protein PGTUg99_026253 [Puccinia graminis f. sp. tritici]KAA1103969.1 hypothetical protein PGT21_006306 [Puccinia graminis f. sp. tritici]
MYPTGLDAHLLILSESSAQEEWPLEDPLHHPVPTNHSHITAEGAFGSSRKRHFRQTCHHLSIGIEPDRNMYDKHLCRGNREHHSKKLVRSADGHVCVIWFCFSRLFQ